MINMKFTLSLLVINKTGLISIMVKGDENDKYQ